MKKALAQNIQKTLTVFFHALISLKMKESPCPKYCGRIWLLHRRRRKGYLAATGCAGPGELSFAPQSPSDCRRGRREGELCCRTKSSDWKCWDFEEEAFPKRFVTSVLFFGPDLREGKRDEGKRERSENGDQSLVSGVLVDHHDGLHQHGHEVGARGRVHRRHPCHQ